MTLDEAFKLYDDDMYMKRSEYILYVKISSLKVLKKLVMPYLMDQTFLIPDGIIADLKADDWEIA